jgi:hypothetical protein
VTREIGEISRANGASRGKLGRAGGSEVVTMVFWPEADRERAGGAEVRSGSLLRGRGEAERWVNA